MRSAIFHTAAAALAITGCSGFSSAGEKSGGDATPVTLRLGTIEGEGAPYADEVEMFADAVETSSGGSIDVEIVWEAPGPYTGESERNMAAMVRDGEFDLAVVPTRVWDQLDVTSFQALQAPFLVDNLGLLNRIAGGDLATEMLAGLDPIGIEGLAVWPESLRHPIGFAGPLLTAADFEGAQLRVPTSGPSIGLAEALGVVAVDNPEDWSAAVAAGELDGAESAFVWARDLPAFGTMTGNITFYPKANTIVANADAFDALGGDGQDALRRAAAEALDYVVETNASEHDLALEYCAAGGSVALAGDNDIAELTELAGPVLTELEQDAGTKGLIDAIRAIDEESPSDAADLPAACEPEAEDAPVADSGAEAQTFPDGVYRAEIEDAPFAPGTTLVTTMTFVDGAWRTHDDSGAPDCAGSYVVESGRVRISMSTDVALACGNPPGEEFLDAAWTFENDELRFTDINSDPSAVYAFGNQPWTQIEGDGAATAEATFPEGVYRAEIEDAPFAPGTTLVFTMEFQGGVWESFLESELDCAGTYRVESGRIFMSNSTDPALACGNEPGFEFLDATWTLENGELRFVDINSDPNAVYAFGNQPWTKIE